MIGPDRGGSLIGHRCSAWGRGGAVATSAPEAALVGRDMIRDGGNAFDAAIAAALAETVVVPSKCGLAGDLVALVHRPDDEVSALVAIGGAPETLERAVADRGLPVRGGLAVGVPGAPAGYAAIAELGEFTLAELVAPAVEIARTGFPWSPLSHDYSVRAADLLRQENPEGVVFMPGGRPIATGAWTTLPGHARALEAYADLGADLFAGEIGELVAATVAARGGVITVEDLARAGAEWTSPPAADIDGRRMWVTPAPTHGPALLATVLDGTGGTDDQFARVRRAQERQRREAGDPVGDTGTSVVTAADRLGNVVVIVHSLSHPSFGSGIVVPELDMVLGNRAGRGFTPVPGHPNAPVAGRRPLTTLHAWALAATERDVFTAGATSGGEQQLPWNVQVVERYLRTQDPAASVLDPLWAVTPTGGARQEVDSTSCGDATPAGIETVPALSLEAGSQIVQSADRRGVCRVVTDIRSVGGAAA